MKREILRLVKLYSDAGAALEIERSVSPELQRALEALGYVE